MSLAILGIERWIKDLKIFEYFKWDQTLQYQMEKSSAQDSVWQQDNPANLNASAASSAGSILRHHCEILLGHLGEIGWSHMKPVGTTTKQKDHKKDQEGEGDSYILLDMGLQPSPMWPVPPRQTPEISTAPSVAVPSTREPARSRLPSPEPTWVSSQ